MLQVIPVAAGAFVATNLDNFALLVTFLARYRQRSFAVGAAYFAGILLLSLVGLGIGITAALAPVEYLGWLGLVPIALGILGIVELVRKKQETEVAQFERAGGLQTAFFATLLAQLGNGTDTLITLAALFADSNPVSDIIIALTLLGMGTVFFTAALYAIRRPALAAVIDRYAPRVTPFILIAVGAYIVANTATDVLPG